MPDERRTWPIRWLLTALFGLVVLVSLLPVAILDSVSTANLLLDRAVGQQLLSARRTVDRIESYFEALLTWGRDFSNRPAIRTWLERGDYAAPPGRARWEEEILLPFRKRWNLAATFVATPAGEPVLGSGRLVFPAALARWTYFAAARAGQEGISDVFTDPSGQGGYLAALVPIVSPGSQRVVAVVGAVDTTGNLRRIVREDTGAIGPGSFGVLLDEVGIRLAHGTSPSQEGVPVTALAPDLLARLRGERRFGAATPAGPGVPGVEIPELAGKLEELRRDPGGSPFLRRPLAVTGEGSHGAIVPLKTKRWFYNFGTPDSYFYAPVWRQLRQNALILLGVLLLVCGLSWSLARTLSQPLLALQGAAKSLERGILGARAPVSGSQELTSLADSFNRMADRLQRHAQGLEDEVRQRTEQLASANAHLRESEERLRTLVDELRDRNEKLEALDRLRNDFINAVSHDLRTPLTTIRGYAEFLEDEVGGALKPDQALFVKQIQQGTMRLERLVDDLLDFARIEAGSFRLSLVQADLGAKIEEIAESFRPQAQEARLELLVRLPGKLPPQRMDPQRIGQVLTNLIANSIKFTPPGGRVELTAREVDGNLTCEVADTGIGIAQEDLPKLFRRFSQLDAGRSKGGTGLGLSISKSIVDAHGGEIGVTSQPGCGSTFWFKLPGSSPVSPDHASPPLAGYK